MLLIIDDEQAILSSLSMMFEQEGIKTVTETNPLKAIELFRNETFNVVLVDIVMPEMHGDEVIRVLRQINPMCSFIVMTAYSSMKHVIECIEAGAYDYVTKPLLDMDLLITIVRQALARAQRWQGSFGLSRSNAKGISKAAEQ